MIDPKWSKPETDYLLELCQKYNHRFQIIADRYEYDSERPRSIEVIIGNIFLYNGRYIFYIHTIYIYNFNRI